MGFKMCNIFGHRMVYDFIMYGREEIDIYALGNNLWDQEAHLQPFLAKHAKQLSSAYFFRFFCSLELIEYLRREFEILALGTTREDRLRLNPFKSDKILKEERRGAYDMYACNKSKLVCIKCYGNKRVTLSSSFADDEPARKVKSYSKKTSGKIYVKCPDIIQLTHVRC